MRGAGINMGYQAASLLFTQEKKGRPANFFFHIASEDHVIKNPTEGGFFVPFSIFLLL